MDRKEFIRVCGGACLGVLGISMLQSCETTKYVQGTIIGSQLALNENDFVKLKDEKKTFRKYVLVKPQGSDYPVIVFRQDENNYTALLMRCTHQGNELTANGDLLTCSAHGSEFAKTGEVVTGPAEQKLKSFPVTVKENMIYIQLT